MRMRLHAFYEVEAVPRCPAGILLFQGGSQ